VSASREHALLTRLQQLAELLHLCLDLSQKQAPASPWNCNPRGQTSNRELQRHRQSFNGRFTDSTSALYTTAGYTWCTSIGTRRAILTAAASHTVHGSARQRRTAYTLASHKLCCCPPVAPALQRAIERSFARRSLPNSHALRHCGSVGLRPRVYTPPAYI
jgi:hypothetical protein